MESSDTGIIKEDLVKQEAFQIEEVVNSHYVFVF